MKDIVCKELKSFKSIVEAYQFRKMSLDYKQNVMLLVQKNTDQPCIIYLDKNNLHIKSFNLNVDIDVESVQCMQQIGERWLLIFNYEGDNAVIYNADGSEYCKFYAGEGIQDCQVDVNGDIWVSYCDEGVFGECPIGVNGIVAFDSKGQLIFDSYDQYVERFNVPPIDDCYAMNVIDGDVWLYYYSEFPLVQMKDKEIHMSWNEINVIKEIRSESFAVAQDKVVFITQDKKLVVYDLNNNYVHDMNLRNERGEPIQIVTYYSRGSVMYFQTDDRLYYIDAINM
ncbi:hypothetical protein COL68_23125 [Bacillus wiedmannii]|uniref:hypothetical protein n=1 Tax=Bacillus TaxID=1386 RepID=UPI00065B9FBF|nr:hypothetical protein [Bacillus wiedmannii]KMP93546.1 hypothetical protein TU65_18630 [Bacillus wiedmannii]MCU5517423.1 hypothetical protein [Bacillus wiedmannii]PFY92540.1 hypothetical protein COL57_27130 [Bacillus wiedmannii]PFZ53780.1 hypothetical protein COL68_23125 [Bacillus wiedmannii]PGB81058.1 hypothetical protein COM03_09805 [Bacillus wiedmannii]